MNETKWNNQVMQQMFELKEKYRLENKDLRAKLEKLEEDRNYLISDSTVVSTENHRKGVKNLKLQQDNADLQSQVAVLKGLLEKARDCICTISDKAPGYDWNSDPLYLTRIIGDSINSIDQALQVTPVVIVNKEMFI